MGTRASDASVLRSCRGFLGCGRKGGGATGAQREPGPRAAGRRPLLLRRLAEARARTRALKPHNPPRHGILWMRFDGCRPAAPAGAGVWRQRARGVVQQLLAVINRRPVGDVGLTSRAGRGGGGWMEGRQLRRRNAPAARTRAATSARSRRALCAVRRAASGGRAAAKIVPGVRGVRRRPPGTSTCGSSGRPAGT